MQFFIPEYIEKILNTIEKAGGEAYIVGGCVRDMLLNLKPNDFDITTSLLPEEIISLFDKTVATGIKHGTVTVVIDKNNVEVTTYRTDGLYSDSRHPENINYVKNLKEDLARRDFTVNAIAYNKNVGIVDCFGGLDDLKNKLLRTVGDPYKRFGEDALRIMRLFRFSAQLGFDIAEETITAATKCVYQLENISRERIATELFKTVLSDSPERIYPLLSTGALEFCSIPKGKISSALALLPKDRNIRFFAFLNQLSADHIKVCKELKTDRALIEFCSEVVKILDDVPDNIKSCKWTLNSFSEESVYCAMLLTGKDTSIIKSIHKSGEPYKIAHLDINGDDLKNLGITGRKTGEILIKLLGHIIEHPEENKKAILIKLISNQN